MAELQARLVDPKTHPNIRLFILKLIVNGSTVFEPYARFWFKPMVQTLTQTDFGATPFNYFVRDVCLTFLKWSVSCQC